MNLSNINIIKQHLCKHVIPISRCNNSRYNEYMRFSRLFKYIAAGDFATIYLVQRHCPTMLKFKCVNDIKVYAIKMFNKFVYKNGYFPARGQLVIDGFWDLHKLRYVENFNYVYRRMLQYEPTLKKYQNSEIKKICNTFIMILKYGSEYFNTRNDNLVLSPINAYRATTQIPHIKYVFECLE